MAQSQSNELYLQTLNICKSNLQKAYSFTYSLKKKPADFLKVLYDISRHLVKRGELIDVALSLGVNESILAQYVCKRASSEYSWKDAYAVLNQWWEAQPGNGEQALSDALQAASRCDLVMKFKDNLVVSKACSI